MLSGKIKLIDWVLILVKIISDNTDWFFLFDNRMIYEMRNLLLSSTDRIRINLVIKSENSRYQKPVKY
jgi:hypothetical protein